MAGFDALLEWAAAGYRLFQIGRRHTSGAFAGFAGLDTTDSGLVSGMKIVEGAISAPFNFPEDETVPVEGDNGETRYLFTFKGQNTVGLTFENVITQLDVEAAMQNSTTHTIGKWTFGGRGGRISKLPDMVGMLTRDAIAADGTESGGYEHLWIGNSTFRPVGDAQWQSRAAGGVRYNATVREFSRLPWGTTTQEDLGMGSTMVVPFTSEYPMTVVSVIGDGTTDPITLPYAPMATDRIKIFNYATGAEVAVSAIDEEDSTVTPGAALADEVFHIVMMETLDVLTA